MQLHIFNLSFKNRVCYTAKCRSAHDLLFPGIDLNCPYSNVTIQTTSFAKYVEIYKSSVSLRMSLTYTKYQLVWQPLKGLFPRLGICNTMPRIPDLPRIAHVSAWAQLDIGCNAETKEFRPKCLTQGSREHYGDHTRRSKVPGQWVRSRPPTTAIL